MSDSEGKQEGEAEAEETTVKEATETQLPEDDQKPGPSTPILAQRNWWSIFQCCRCRHSHTPTQHILNTAAEESKDYDDSSPYDITETLPRDHRWPPPSQDSRGGHSHTRHARSNECRDYDDTEDDVSPASSACRPVRRQVKMKGGGLPFFGLGWFLSPDLVSTKKDSRGGHSHTRHTGSEESDIYDDNPSTSALLVEAQCGALTWMEMDFRPEVSTQSGHVSYRFRCPGSGAFHCTSTGLVFVVTKEAELQYRTVQWDETLLMSTSRTAAGPLYDIECPERAVCELHLPHCEADDADLSKSQLSVAHITDSGMSFIEPLRITETHVVIEVSGLSLFGLLWNWLFNKHKAVSGQVLLFCSPKNQNTQKLKVNMFLLPRNISVDQVKQKQWTTTQYIDAPSKCILVIDQHYSVVCPNAEKIQPERALFDMDHEPNYHPSFEVRLLPESSKVTITLREAGNTEAGESEVWKHELDLTEPALSKDRTMTHQRNSPKAELSSVRVEFVKNVSDPVLNQLLDRLLEKQIMNSEEMEFVKVKPRADKARLVVDTVIKKGSRAASVLIRDFCELDPNSDLCSKLRSLHL